ncbi:hypothetical protein NMG60_11012810 [Bertholletia excelsa]
MGSGDWFKYLISLKKGKIERPKRVKGSTSPEESNGVKGKSQFQKDSIKLVNGTSNGKESKICMPGEDLAATRIQTAFRAYKARKYLRHLKAQAKLQFMIQSYSVSKQASITLSYLHSWSRIQAQIRARRISMVTEGRMKQKKLENQLKLEAKLHDLEVEWNGGSEAMEETLARIHQREEAAVKRERALAYAFSHQWRANSNSTFGPSELGKANWGWSWTERWVAARPWESRLPIQASYKKTPSQLTSKDQNANTPTRKTPVSVKNISPNGKGPMKARKLSYPATEKAFLQGNTKSKETNVEKE